MDALQALTYERRSGIATIKGRRFRITEPLPRVASVILTHVAKLVRPWVVKILAGQIVLNKPSVCPQCGTEGKAERVNGERWLCQTLTEKGQPCGALWPREVDRGEDGKPVVMTLSRALADQTWRGLFAYEIGQTIDDLDPDEAHTLAMRMILSGGTEWETVAGSGQWIVIGDEKALDMALAQAKIGGVGIMRLAKEHLRIWALPSLVDDWTDTSPASPTTATDGGSETREPGPPESAPAGRVPPRTRKHRG